MNETRSKIRQDQTHPLVQFTLQSNNFVVITNRHMTHRILKKGINASVHENYFILTLHLLVNLLVQEHASTDPVTVTCSRADRES